MWIGLTILLGFCVWAFVYYDFSAVVSALAAADWRLILVAIVCHVLLLYFTVFKWRFFFGSSHKVSFYDLSMAAFAASTFNMIMPARVGGLIQAWLLGHKASISKSTALGTVALVHLMDLITVVAVGLLVFLFLDVPPEKGNYWVSLQKAGIIFSSCFLFIVLILFFFRKNKKFVEVFKRTALFLAPERFKLRVREAIERFLKGFGVLNETRYLLTILLLSFIFWCLTAITIVIFLKAFGVGNIQLITPFFILVAQMVGFLIPAPAGIGPYHAATVISLSFYGITGELALSIAILMHTIMFVTNTLPGLLYLWHENIQIGTLVKKAKLTLSKEKNGVME